MEGNNEVGKLFLEINKTVERFGLKKVIDILRSYQKSDKELSNEEMDIANQIIDYICENFSITRNILFDQSRSVRKRHTMCVCAYFLRKKMNLDNVNISLLLNKHPADVSNYLSFVSQLSETIKHEKDLKEKIKELEQSIK